MPTETKPSNSTMSTLSKLVPSADIMSMDLVSMDVPKLYNKKTRKYVTLATAKRAGLDKRPTQFDIPEGFILLKQTDKSGISRNLLVPKANAEKALKREGYSLHSANNEVYVNPNTGRINRKQRRADGTLNKITKTLLNTSITNKLDYLFAKPENRSITIRASDIEHKDIEDLLTMVYNRFKQSPRLIRGLNIQTLDPVNREQASHFVNKQNLNKIDRWIDNLTERNTEQEQKDSDDENVHQLTEYVPDKIKLTIYTRPRYTKPSGAFFPYFNKTGIDLTDLQIIDKDFFDKEKEKEQCKSDLLTKQCLVYALEKSGLVTRPKLEEIATNIYGDLLPKKKLKDIAEKYNLHLRLKTGGIERGGDRQGQLKFEYITYGNSSEPMIELGLINNKRLTEPHYFLSKPINGVSRFYINNMDELHERFGDKVEIEKLRTAYQWKDATHNSLKYKPNVSIDSFELIRLILDKPTVEKWFEPYSQDDLLFTHKAKSIKSVGCLDFEETNLSYELNDPKSVEDKSPGFMEAQSWGESCISKNKTFYFDFETYPDECDVHIPYLCCVIDNTENDYNPLSVKTFYGNDCGRQLLEYIDERISECEYALLYAHNASYDWTFILPYLTEAKPLMRGKKLISCDAYTYSGGTPIKIVDTLQMISKPLCDFGSCFHLNQAKEVMPYKAFNPETMDKTSIRVDYAITQGNFSDEEASQFKENIEKWGLYTNTEKTEFNHIEYSARYCQLDVCVLKEGWLTFNKWIKEATKLNTFNSLTLPSLADKYFKKQGAYAGIPSLSGLIQKFFQDSVVGGRVMSRKNEKQYIPSPIADFDAVSLYPSAMNRLELPLGTPFILPENSSEEYLLSLDGFTAEFEVTKVGIQRDFPVMSYKNEKGIRQWSNDMVGKSVVINEIDYRDWKDFQGVEFRFKRGYGFNGGKSTLIQQIIKTLFDERKTQKKAENPIQEVYKLLMNSGYGKCVQKPITTEIRFSDTECDMKKHVCFNSDYVKSITEINCEVDVLEEYKKKYAIKSDKPFGSYFNNAIVGTRILSMAKRIMNEVMCLAEDNGINMYYTDTDSIHMDLDGVEPLAKLFKEKYDRELIGEDMGQFHIDFECPKSVDKKTVYSTKLIALGKKCYVDKLTGRYKKTGEEWVDYHIRMKGVPTKSIRYTADKYYEGDVMALYEDLYKGKEVAFDLLCGGQKDMFANTNFRYSMRKQFIRKIKFQDFQEDEEEEE